MSIPRLLSRWKSEPSIANAIQVWRELPARPARWASLPQALHPALAAALARRGVEQLYTHQAQSFAAAAAGQDLVIVTGTASGKSLCYQLPLLDRLLRDPQKRGLLIFPTKALAQDQTASLRALIEAIPEQNGLSVGIYDGDTPAHARQPMRASARLLVTNPDMLHLGILPHHTSWGEFFANLSYVVIDEAHVYRGVFGSHVANVLRRLRRVAAFYGSRPQFILTSATISNPQELAGQLVEREVTLIDQDGAGRGPKTFLFYNPPVIDPSLGLRRGALQESVRLADDLLAYGVQTIVFGRSRRTVELLLTYLRQRAAEAGAPPASPAPPDTASPARVRGYRSGYRPEQRREIERGLREGQVRAVVATNALELGIDIGGMGAALLVGYPGTIAAAWQQAGRAGRAGDEFAPRSLAVLVATADPLDQFLAAHPDYFFERSSERALTNPDNPLILLDHLRCAAFELPFKTGERFGRLDPDELNGYLDFLTEQGVLHASGGRRFWMADQYPAQAVSLRSATAQPVLLQVFQDEQPLTLGQVDWGSALWMAHPQAVYLHEAETYVVDELNLETHTARLHPERVDYYTLPRRETAVELIELRERLGVCGGAKSEGEISVTTRVTGFKRLRWFTHELIDQAPLDLPPSTLLTTGYWLSLSPETVDQLRDAGLWSNARNDYGPNWEVQRQRALERDRYTCQVCGASGQGRSLHVHHKTPFRMFDSFIQANLLENLVSLCPECHRRVETAVRVRSGLAGLAYALGNLAPFFLMCDVSDLGVHSDPQSPLAQSDPAVVIYDQVPAGLGFSRQLFELHDELVRSARELVSACACSDGCPSCVGPGGEGGAGGKEAALAILNLL